MVWARPQTYHNCNHNLHSPHCTLFNSLCYVITCCCYITLLYNLVYLCIPDIGWLSEYCCVLVGRVVSQGLCDKMRSVIFAGLLLLKLLFQATFDSGLICDFLTGRWIGAQAKNGNLSSAIFQPNLGNSHRAY